MKTINSAGLAAIREFLSAHHKRGRTMTAAMMSAWATEAEQSMLDGNPAMIEIRAVDAITGQPVTFTVPPTGVDSPADAQSKARADAKRLWCVIWMSEPGGTFDKFVGFYETETEARDETPPHDLVTDDLDATGTSVWTSTVADAAVYDVVSIEALKTVLWLDDHSNSTTARGARAARQALIDAGELDADELDEAA